MNYELTQLILAIVRRRTGRVFKVMDSKFKVTETFAGGRHTDRRFADEDHLVEVTPLLCSGTRLRFTTQLVVKDSCTQWCHWGGADRPR